MENLLKETIRILEINNKIQKEVRWVGSKDGSFSISFSEFKKIADTEYNSGYGSQEIADDLVVVGDDWWLERYEYDGSECWDFKIIPKQKKETIKFKQITTKENCWVDLKEINNYGKK